MNHIYLPTSGAHEWQWLLAKPGLHWKHGASAMALADAWENADGWPAPVATALDGNADLADSQLLLAIPEREVPLPGGSRASQTDLFVLARSPAGDLITIAVEGKAEESFGDQTVEAWRSSQSSGRVERLTHLLGVLGLPDDERLAAIRYQLLHRTASAVIEASALRREARPDARALVQRNRCSLRRLRGFAALYADDVGKGRAARVAAFDGITLHLGWVSDRPRPLDPAPRLGPRFDRAFAWAQDLHRDQCRKCTTIPYISHLMAVASLVLEDGGDEDKAIAALLHDAVEDGDTTLTAVEQLFGRRVAALVGASSEERPDAGLPWRERKEAYIAHLRCADLPDGALGVSLADKLHNARSMLFDLRAGHDVWARFRAPQEDQLWYYRSLAAAFADRSDSPMVAELRRVVDELDDRP